MVKVTARQRVYYAGKEYAPGDDLDVTERHAIQLGAIRKVMRAETASEPPPDEPAPPEQPPGEHPPKVRYKRRDLKAED